eukprot:TRINITY_DN3714_c0_g1_i3.p1 TRINITY_DN3714_c0_g1~~TRINITY_DN3714_c0_g1_i3.p1  ORF type:complete len:417 (+),score=41.15 TRINITY_DN3714_c0_g1_i3:181-1431(+)
MDSLEVSACPVCRHRYDHLPNVCLALHFFLLQTYPNEYEARRLELLEDGMTEPPLQASPGAAVPKLIELFRCEGCDELAYKPVVRSCGHILCLWCFYNPVAPFTPPDTCPGCDDTTTEPADLSPCLLLESALRSFASLEYAARAQDLEDFQKLLPELIRAQLDRKHQSEEQHRQQRILVQQRQRAYQMIQEIIHRSDAQRPPEGVQYICMDSASFAHFGVGCDACGKFPIRGARWKCKECSHNMGFDLCGHCYMRNPAAGGRFGQGHLSSHSMVEVQPEPTLLHILHALNPELSLHQISTYLSLMGESDRPPLTVTTTTVEADPEPTESLENVAAAATAAAAASTYDRNSRVSNPTAEPSERAPSSRAAAQPVLEAAQGAPLRRSRRRLREEDEDDQPHPPSSRRRVESRPPCNLS